MKLYEPAAADTLPGRDRVIVAGLLLLVAALAWAFTVHQAIRMDEMEAAMWRDMNMSMNGMEPSWNASRCRDAVCDVVSDDGGNDDTWCQPNDHRIFDNQSPAAGARRTLRANRRLSARLPRSLGRIFSYRYRAPMAATGYRPSHYNDAVFILLLVGCTLRRCRSLPTQPIEGDVPSPLPFARRFILSEWRDGIAWRRVHGACDMDCFAWGAARPLCCSFSPLP